MKKVVLLMALGMLSAYGETARIRALVIDATTGAPITGRVVTAFFESRNKWSQNVTDRQDGLTDEKGMCSFTGSTNIRNAGCVVWRGEGYYRAECKARFTGVSLLPFNRLQPDNQVLTMKVQRVERPIPLHINRLNTDFGVDLFTTNNNQLKYDLLASDWLAPMGSGVVADVVFTRLPRKVFRTGRSSSGHKVGDFYRAEMDISFPGEGNGIREIDPPLSEYLPIRMAPEDGYEHKVTASEWTDDNLQTLQSWDKEKVYCFRIRSVSDGEGKLVSANYGKIYNGLKFTDSQNPTNPVGGVEIDFMLNPSPLDRNLEWNGVNTNERETSIVNNLLP